MDVLFIFFVLGSCIYTARQKPESRREPDPEPPPVFLFRCFCYSVNFSDFFQHFEISKNMLFFVFQKILTFLRGVRFNQLLHSFNLLGLFL